ncbi:TraB/GumN family protein [Rhodoferax sp.]|uniref:TraB/GumN family protein n=1 Tax=Rhodoferax sp. TaxID=50421 RepID=UPI00374CB1D3
MSAFRALLLASLLLPGIAWAQPAAESCVDTTPAPPPAVPATDRGFLWRIDKDGSTSYLYGTLHIGRADWASPGPQVLAALQASKVLALEMDSADPQTMRALLAGLARQTSQTLAPPLEARLRQALATSCLPVSMAQAFAPEVLTSLLVVDGLRRDGFSAELGIDNLLAQTAHAAQMPVVGLETPLQQLQLLLADSPQERSDGVTEILDDLDSGKARRILLMTVRMWAEADHAMLQDYTAWCECNQTVQDRKMLKAMLDDRNTQMAEGIDRLHRQGQPVFAAVGSLHMAGPLGLPAWMAQHGYRVQRVEFGAR